MPSHKFLQREQVYRVIIAEVANLCLGAPYRLTIGSKVRVCSLT